MRASQPLVTVAALGPILVVSAMSLSASPVFGGAIPGGVPEVAE